jgi:hypothetical protein
MHKQHKEYIRLPLEEYFKTERDFSLACRRVFSSGEGAKILGQLLKDYNYHLPDSPKLNQSLHPNLSYEDFLKYRAAQKEVLAHLLFGRNAEYSLVGKDESLINNEDDND